MALKHLSSLSGEGGGLTLAPSGHRLHLPLGPMVPDGGDPSVVPYSLARTFWPLSYG